MTHQIKFSGLCWNPSEHEAADGTLCAMVNLIAEDEALKPCRLPNVPADEGPVIEHSDLLYDISVSQNQPILCTVSTNITPTLTNYLRATNEPLPTRRTLIDRIFPHFYDSREAYATGATMVAAQVEAAIDREASRLGAGVFKHISFGMVVLRLSDGSQTLCSNIFALMPATVPSTVYADHETGQLTCSVSLHRHSITVAMHHPASPAVRLVDSAEVYLSRPVSFLDVRKALQTTMNDAGLATSLTFGVLGPQATAEVFERLEFYLSTIIDHNHFGQPVALQNVSALSKSLDLSDLRRWSATARHSFVSHGRRYLAAFEEQLHNPFEIGLTYQYLSADAASRQSATAAELDTLQQSELIAGSRPDIYDTPYGIRAEVVVRLSMSNDIETWFGAEVSYPLCGPLMYPDRRVSYEELHLRVMAPDGDHYFTTTVHLKDMGDRGYRAAVFSPSGGVHRSTRPAFYSLLLQQASILYLDTISGEYLVSSWLWENETVAEFTAAKSKVGTVWRLPVNDRDTLSSSLTHPLVLQRDPPGSCPVRTSTTYGNMMSVAMNGQQWACTTPQGVLLSLRGNIDCVSEALHGHPFDLRLLPHLDDILATQPDIRLSSIQYAPFRPVFMPSACLRFDERHQRLILSPTDDAAFHDYTLIYSMRSKQWGAVSTTGISSHTEETPFFLCTRALCLGKPTHQSISGVTLVGHIDDSFHHSSIGMALYGSNDLYHWQLIATSRNRRLSHLYGTPYRWFRVAAIGTLRADECIEGMVVSF